MIVGIGTDLIKVARIEDSIDRLGDRFAKRILSGIELEVYQRSATPARYMAKRFAAKEAVAKALGCGIGRGAGWGDIIISNDDSGAPGVALVGAAKASAESKGVTHSHLSISDEQDYALAFVVLSAF